LNSLHPKNYSNNLTVFTRNFLISRLGFLILLVLVVNAENGFEDRELVPLILDFGSEHNLVRSEESVQITTEEVTEINRDGLDEPRSEDTTDEIDTMLVYPTKEMYHTEDSGRNLLVVLPMETKSTTSQFEEEAVTVKALTLNETVGEEASNITENLIEENAISPLVRMLTPPQLDTKIEESELEQVDKEITREDSTEIPQKSLIFDEKIARKIDAEHQYMIEDLQEALSIFHNLSN
jgi:hypothetical protein